MGRYEGYRERSSETNARHASQQGGNFDGIFKDGIPTWKITEGEHQCRILPPTWSDTERWSDHWGIEVWAHGNVGADNGRYLCLKKMRGEDCPVCEAVIKAKADGDEEYADKIKAGKRILAWIIDRDDEKAGPQVWDLSWTLDKDIANRCQSKRDNSVILIDHPDKGYDLFFKREGKQLQTRYIAMEIDRNESYISQDAKQQDKWLDYVAENPLPDVLEYKSAEYIQKVLDGKVAKSNRGDDDDKGRGRDRDGGDRRASHDEDKGRGRERDDSRGRDESDRSSSRDRDDSRGRDEEDRRGSRDDDRRGGRGRDDDDSRSSRDDDRRSSRDDDRRSSRGRDDDDDCRSSRDDDRSGGRGREREPAADKGRDDDDRGRGRGRERDDDDRSSGRGREREPADDKGRGRDDDDRSSGRGRDRDESPQDSARESLGRVGKGRDREPADDKAKDDKGGRGGGRARESLDDDSKGRGRGRGDDDRSSGRGRR